ncbi:hypothetical protein [Undibacterium luofuense]|uniref:hypothetical protein n=1 Tax=Undibacterium luofuense TaxID=2828733 RepID=UPI0030EE1AD1
MKKTWVMLAMTAAVLSACGGGGSDSGNNSSSSSSGSSSSGGGSGSGSGSGGGAATLTASMQEAVNVFAESWIATQLMMNAHYYLYMAANVQGSVNCPKGGTAALSGGNLTVNKCTLTFPADNSFSGTVAVTTNPNNTLAISSNSALSVYDTGNGSLVFNINNLAMAGSVASVDQLTDSVKVSSLSAAFPLSASNTYNISNTTTSLTKTNQNTTSNFAGSALNMSFAYTYKRNTGNSNVVTSTVENMVIPADTSSTKGITNNPTGGQYSIAQGGTGSCGTISVTFRSGNAINLICQKTGETQTFNWNDSTIAAAKAKAIQ